MRPLTAMLLAATLGLAACSDLEETMPTTPGPSLMNAAAEPAPVPFHSEIAWTTEYGPLPAGRCTAALPPGMDYLYYARLSGTGTSTHLGQTTFEGDHCIFGVLTNPSAPPEQRGTPAGWIDERLVFTAANGDELHVHTTLTGQSGQGTPEWYFAETGVFVDGGTGRFAHAAGQLEARIYPVKKIATFDGSLRYGGK